jgi:hypothetical protein
LQADYPSISENKEGANMKKVRTLLIIATTCLIAGTSGMTQSWAASPDSEQVSKLLAEVRGEALLLRDDAQLMESYTRSDISRETQGRTVTAVRAHVNAIGKKLAELMSAKNSASPWQVAAIERIQPWVRELATNTSRAIGYINSGPANYKTGEYKEYLEANSDVSNGLFSLISDFVDYGNSKDRMDRLATRLEISEK